MNQVHAIPPAVVNGRRQIVGSLVLVRVEAADVREVDDVSELRLMQVEVVAEVDELRVLRPVAAAKRPLSEGRVEVRQRGVVGK